MEVQEKSGKRSYGRIGCLVGLLILIILIILFFAGAIDFPWKF